MHFLCGSNLLLCLGIPAPLGPTPNLSPDPLPISTCDVFSYYNCPHEAPTTLQENTEVSALDRERLAMAEEEILIPQCLHEI